MDIPQMTTQNILKKTAWMVTYLHENSQEKQKKYNTSKKFFGKDNFTYDNEIKTYICPLGQPLYKIKEYTYDDKPRTSHWTKKCKNYPMQPFCAKGNRSRIIQDYRNPSKIRMQRKMETTEAKEIYKLHSKTAELPFAHKTKHSPNRI